MHKTILSLTAAGALALAGIAAAPQPAHAVAWWVAPAIIAGTVGGVAVGATAANANLNNNLAYAPAPGAVYVAPTATCHWRRVETESGRLVRTRVCD